MQFIALDVLEKVKKAVPKMAEKPKTQFTKSQALEFLKDEIALLLAKNYSLSEIIDFLKEQGLSVSITTLKSFLKAARAKQTQSKKSKNKPQSAK